MGTTTRQNMPDPKLRGLSIIRFDSLEGILKKGGRRPMMGNPIPAQDLGLRERAWGLISLRVSRFRIWGL